MEQADLQKGEREASGSFTTEAGRPVWCLAKGMAILTTLLCGRHCDTMAKLTDSSHQLIEVATITIFILQMRKPRHQVIN